MSSFLSFSFSSSLLALIFVYLLLEEQYLVGASYRFAYFGFSSWWRNFKGKEHQNSTLLEVSPSSLKGRSSPVIEKKSAPMNCTDTVNHSTEPDSQPESVHLQLLERWKTPEDNSNTSKNFEDNKIVNSTNTVLISEFRVLETNELVAAVFGSNRTKLEYFCLHLFHKNYSELPNFYSYIEKEIDRHDTEAYQQYHNLWKQSRLLTQKKSLDDDWQRSDTTRGAVNGKRSNSIEAIMNQNLSKMKLINQDYQPTLHHLRSFLEDKIGIISNQTIQYYEYHAERGLSEQLDILKNFALWFRKEFPYYYDGCLYCLNHQVTNEYLGSVYAETSERIHHAGKTELYLCSQCRMISRFPRYNDMKQVLKTKRGRCGEYSILMMLFLQSLNYTARYIVDREDHAWTEVLLFDQWIHIDPCEAAINEPLIYQSWGKNQTYIFALDLLSQDIEDVTTCYTSIPEAVYSRREAEGMNASAFQTFLQTTKQSFRQLLTRQQYQSDNNDTNSVLALKLSSVDG